MLNYFEEKSSLKSSLNELKSCDLFFYKKFLWKVKKKIREVIREKNGEDERAKRNKC